MWSLHFNPWILPEYCSDIQKQYRSFPHLRRRMEGLGSILEGPMRKLQSADLPLLNAILDARPDLAAALEAAVTGWFASLPANEAAPLAPPAQTTLPGMASPGPSPDEWAERISRWFAAHPGGRHGLGEVRADLGAPGSGPGAKAFKTGLHRAIDRGTVATTGLRGRGAGYWAPEKKRTA